MGEVMAGDGSGRLRIRWKLALVLLVLLGLYRVPILFGDRQLTLPAAEPPNDIGALVHIPGGTFMMGAPPKSKFKWLGRSNFWYQLATPQHPETVPPFKIGKYKVTTSEYCDFLNAIREEDGKKLVNSYVGVDYSSTVLRTQGVFHPRPGYEYAPAIHVQLEGARRYCEWLSEKTGQRYRLPTEIEWEFAARGTEGRTYPWGEESPVGRAYLRKHYRATDHQDAPGVINVGSFPSGATPEGVHDFIGSAGEWCGNCYYDYSNESITADPARFQAFANPSDDCRGITTRLGSTPAVAERGGQNITHSHIATAWTRTSLNTNLPGRLYDRGTAFRVLQEISE